MRSPEQANSPDELRAMGIKPEKLQAPEDSSHPPRDYPKKRRVRLGYRGPSPAELAEIGGFSDEHELYSAAEEGNRKAVRELVKQIRKREQEDARREKRQVADKADAKIAVEIAKQMIENGEATREDLARLLVKQKDWFAKINEPTGALINIERVPATKKKRRFRRRRTKT